MTEIPEDRSEGFHARSVGRREEGSWGRFLLKLGIQDVFYCNEFRCVGTKRHTWRRERPVPTWSRLDRFYTSSALRIKGGRHGIWPTIYHVSDHAGVFLQIPFLKQSRQHHDSFNRKLLNNTEAQDAFMKTWAEAMIETGDYSKATRITTAIEQVRRLSGNITRARKRTARASYQSQFEKTEAAEALLEQDWYDLEAWQMLNEAQGELEMLRMEKLEETRNQFAALWSSVGDRCSKEFFEFHRTPSRKANISELVDRGRTLHSPQEIERYIHYKKPLFNQTNFY